MNINEINPDNLTVWHNKEGELFLAIYNTVFEIEDGGNMFQTTININTLTPSVLTAETVMEIYCSPRMHGICSFIETCREPLRNYSEVFGGLYGYEDIFNFEPYLTPDDMSEECINELMYDLGLHQMSREEFLPIRHIVKAQRSKRYEILLHEDEIEITVN